MSQYGDSAAPTRRRIGLKAPITGLVLILVVVFGANWGWQRAFGDGPTDDVASPDCTTTTPTTTSVPPPTTDPAALAVAAAVTTPAAPPPTAPPPTTPAPTTPVPTTSTPTGPAILMPAAVEVNVYNATARPGLAANTAAGLRDRGFTVLDIDNAPPEDVVAEVAQIRASIADSPQVRLLLQHVPGAVVVPDGRLDATVDLVIGDAFTALGDPATVTPVPLPDPSC